MILTGVPSSLPRLNLILLSKLEVSPSLISLSPSSLPHSQMLIWASIELTKLLSPLVSSKWWSGSLSHTQEAMTSAYLWRCIPVPPLLLLLDPCSLSSVYRSPRYLLNLLRYRFSPPNYRAPKKHQEAYVEQIYNPIRAQYAPSPSALFLLHSLSCLASCVSFVRVAYVIQKLFQRRPTDLKKSSRYYNLFMTWITTVSPLPPPLVSSFPFPLTPYALLFPTLHYLTA